jgi:hypothetical protein
MERNQQMEQFSRAYVYAVAAVAGANVLRWDIDDDSIDIGFGWKKARRARLEAQLKCTAARTPDNGCVKLPISMKNYDDLRADDVVVPRILVVLVVPEPVADWLDQTPERLLIRRCAWWRSLAGLPDVENETKITIDIPTSNVFSPDALTRLLEDAGASR